MHISARVTADERGELAAWLSPEQRRLFAAMHRADRRHGLDVVARLRADGWTDEDVLLAGLFHDAGKGRTGLWPRVAWSLGERYGRLPQIVAGMVPGMRRALAVLDTHPESSARLAQAAGCSERTAALIRDQAHPADDAGRALRRADEAS